MIEVLFSLIWELAKLILPFVLFFGILHFLIEIIPTWCEDVMEKKRREEYMRWANENPEAYQHHLMMENIIREMEREQNR